MTNKCPECKVPWINHLGIIGICRENQQLKSENKKLCKNEGGAQEVTQRIMSDECPTDEVHCTCVPLLRIENLKLIEENNKLITKIDELTEENESLRSHLHTAGKTFDLFAKSQMDKEELIAENDRLNTILEDNVKQRQKTRQSALEFMKEMDIKRDEYKEQE